MVGIAKEVFQVVPGGPGELREKGSGDVIILRNLGHLAVEALSDPHVFDNFDTGVRISIVASGKLHRATSGGGDWGRIITIRVYIAILPPPGDSLKLSTGM